LALIEVFVQLPSKRIVATSDTEGFYGIDCHICLAVGQRVEATRDASKLVQSIAVEQRPQLERAFAE
jgi:hypothetical protein